MPRLLVRDGLTNLHVEHQGTGPALELPHGKVLGELRQLVTIKVCTPKHGTEPCLAMYMVGAR